MNPTIVQWGEWIDIDVNSEHWLKFDQQNRRYYGTPSRNDSRQYQVMLNATDDYTFILEYAYIRVVNRVTCRFAPAGREGRVWGGETAPFSSAFPRAECPFDSA